MQENEPQQKATAEALRSGEKRIGRELGSGLIGYRVLAHISGQAENVQKCHERIHEYCVPLRNLRPV